MLAKLVIIENNNNIQSFGYNEAGALIYHVVDEDKVASLEAIYRAKINSLNKKSRFAYIDYMPNLQGVINLKYTNIQAGSYILCQMTWQGDQNKLPKFSEEIKLLGKYVIVLPNTTEHFFSKALKSSVTEISKKYQNIGLIFRSHVDNLSDYTVVENEIDFLIKDNIAIQNESEKFWGQISKASYKFMQLLRESKLAPTIEVITNSQYIFDLLQPYLDLWQLDAITLDKSLIKDSIIENQKISNTRSEFSLEIHKLSGINLIDINSKNSPLNFYQVNYLAIDEIVRQICLQDLTGIILLDFIKNMSVEETQKLLTKLKKRLESDWRKNQVLGFTKAGICEIIRNK